MGNVGGRSRGCSTCRKRRVKCDENRPICGRCQRCGFECDGPKDITFVKGKILTSRRTGKRTALVIKHETRNTGSIADSTAYLIPLSIPPKGHELEVYVCYTLKRLRGGPVDLALQGTQLSDILSAAPTTVDDHVFHQSVMSFATIFFGSQHRQAYIVHDGYTMLGGTLKQVNQTLSDPKCYTRDEVVLSVVTLALIECFVPTGPQLYLKHMIGLERLLELRGPGSSSSSKVTELYKGVRHMILFASLRTKKPSILARREWKTVLRANCSDEELREQDLFDVLADCTVLVAERESILATSDSELDSSILQLDKVKPAALALLSNLHTWRARWDVDKKNTYYVTPAAFPELRPEPEDTSRPIFTSFEFSNDSTASILTIYNTALICVFQILASLPTKDLDVHCKQIFVQNAQYPSDLREHTKDEYVGAVRLAALEVCRCIPFLIRRDSHLGSRPVHLAVATVWTTLRGDESAEAKWMRKVLNTVGRGFIAKGIEAG